MHVCGTEDGCRAVGSGRFICKGVGENLERRPEQVGSYLSVTWDTLHVSEQESYVLSAQF